MVIKTDSKTVTSPNFGRNSTSPVIVRLRQELDDYQVTLSHVAGRNNILADYLSRAESYSDEEVCQMLRMPPFDDLLKDVSGEVLQKEAPKCSSSQQLESQRKPIHGLHTITEEDGVGRSLETAEGHHPGGKHEVLVLNKSEPVQPQHMLEGLMPSLAVQQRDDLVLREVFSWLQEGGPPGRHTDHVGDLSKYVLIFDRLKVEGELLKCEYVDKWTASRSCLLVLPAKLQVEAILAAHCEGGVHFALKRTLEKLKQHYYFPHMRKQCMLLIACCQLCDHLSAETKKKSLYEAQIDPHVSNFPGALIQIDTSGPFTPSGGATYRYIIAAKCSFTRFVFAKACKGATAQEAADFLLNDVLPVTSLPEAIKSDNGSQFVNSVILIFSLFIPAGILLKEFSLMLVL